MGSPHSDTHGAGERQRVIRRDPVSSLLSPPHVLWVPSPACLLQLGVLLYASISDRSGQNTKDRSPIGREALVAGAKKALGNPVSLGYSAMTGPEEQN